MGFFVTLSVPFDVVDAAFAEKLTYLSNGFVDFTRESITSSSSIYRLSQDQLGKIGEIRLRKLNNAQAELFVKDPPLESIRDSTDDEKRILKSAGNHDEYVRLYLNLFRKLIDEKNELRRKRINHLNVVARSVLAKIELDWINIDYARQSMLAECLNDFVLFVQSELRMSFWRVKEQKRKWINFPEGHAKHLLRSFLAGRYGKDIETFEEINAGAGRIDIYLVTPQNEKAIIELKICGNGYSSGYARKGFRQLEHYMQNKKTENGYLVIFDSRQKDFAKGFDEITNSINTIFVDVRYII